VEVRVENCVFHDNEIGLRLRGPGKGGTGKYGGARVAVANCYFYSSDVAVRYEDKIEDLKLRDLWFGGKVKQTLQRVGGGAGRGFQFIGEHEAPPLAELLKKPAE
jgi:hypothetical protein